MRAPSCHVGQGCPGPVRWVGGVRLCAACERRIAALEANARAGFTMAQRVPRVRRPLAGPIGVGADGLTTVEREARRRAAAPSGPRPCETCGTLVRPACRYCVTCAEARRLAAWRRDKARRRGGAA